ncbi:MAG: hypothetical protein K2J71_04170 [Oscillospiraceae bacterium]|nr:hypothetical protein [Oscillospiraceae bacterium]
MIEKKKPIALDNIENDLPVVPSISNMDDLTALPEDSPENFSFPESENTEPEAILEIPSFLGLDTLDVATAVTQTIRNFSRDSLESPDSLNSLNSFHTFRKLSEISDYINEESSPVQQSEIPDFDNPEESDTEQLPEIPSFLDHDPDLNSDFDEDAENLPDISDFLNLSQNLENSQKNPGVNQNNQEKELIIPEKPENFSVSENLQDLQAAAQEILPEIPSVSDLSDLDFLSMPGNSAFCPEFSEPSGNPEENLLLPEIPSVSDENWDERISTESGRNSDVTENPENPETVPIAELPLSLTALHYLQKIEIHDSLELLETSREALESIPEMDAKTLREILHVRQLQKQNQNQNQNQIQPVSEEFEVLLEMFLKDLEQIGVSESRQLRLKSYLRAIRPEKTEKNTCFSAWYREPHVQMQLDKQIKGLLRKRQMSGLSVNMLADSLPRSLDREILMGMLREMLRADRLMESRDGFYTLKYPPVLKFLADNTDQKQQHIQVLQQRMNGMTPEEIAEQSGMSKERVLEIQNRTLRLVQKLCLINRTSVYEERFRPLYESYELNQEVFGILTKESEQVFRYLELVAFPGSKQPDEVFTDLSVPGWVRENWRAYRNRIF